MPDLLRRSSGVHGKIQNISPRSAGWSYVGFDVYRLNPGDDVTEATGDREHIVVLVEGRANLSVGSEDFGEIGDRLSVFEKTSPHAVYVSGETSWKAIATTSCTLAVGSAPWRGAHTTRLLDPVNIGLIERGKGANTRYIHNIAMEADDVADSLLITEVFTPAGHWSSYPPHRHDDDDFPNITQLEEVYYHRINPTQGYGHQRVFTEDGEIDETYSFFDHDVVLVPKGHHPVGAPYGYELYYLNVMAGPFRRWRFKNHPAHEWIYERDK